MNCTLSCILWCLRIMIYLSYLHDRNGISNVVGDDEHTYVIIFKIYLVLCFLLSFLQQLANSSSSVIFRKKTRCISILFRRFRCLPVPVRQLGFSSKSTCHLHLQVRPNVRPFVYRLSWRNCPGRTLLQAAWKRTQLVLFYQARSQCNNNASQIITTQPPPVIQFRVNWAIYPRGKSLELLQHANDLRCSIPRLGCQQAVGRLGRQGR